MNRKNKIICFILVSFFFLSGIFAQTNFLAPTIPISNTFSTHPEEVVLKTPKTSGVSGHYDYGDGNTMDIDAVDNTTTTTLTNTTSGDHLTIECEKNDSSTSTLFNNTVLNGSLQITSDLENIVQLEGIDYENPLGGFDMIMPEKNQLDYWNPGIEIHSNATVNDVENDLDSFYLQARDRSTGGFFNMTYLKDDPDGYDINVLNGYPTGYMNANLNYENDTNEFKWYDTTHYADIPFPPYHIEFFTKVYTINVSGVWRGDTQVIDWTDPDLETYSYKRIEYATFIYEINITKYYDTIVIHYYGGDPASRGDLYELVFRKTFQDVIVMDWNGQNILWQWKQQLISVSFPVWNLGGEKDFFFVEFYLWDIYDLVYIVLFEIADLRIMFFRIWNEILVSGVRITIVYIQNYIDLSITSYWGFQAWSFSMAYRFDIMQNLFIGYEIQIRYLIWLNIFYVPTLILPNSLKINILQIIYNRKSMDIIIKVTEQFGVNIPGATITGTWDGGSIGTVIDNGDGTYSFTLPAKGKFTRTLSLTASMIGFANGILNVEITVKSPGGRSKTPKGGKGLSEKDFLGLYLLAIVSTIATVFIGKYFGVPKTLGITKYFDKKKYQRNKL